MDGSEIIFGWNSATFESCIAVHSNLGLKCNSGSVFKVYIVVLEFTINFKRSCIFRQMESSRHASFWDINAAWGEGI